MSREELYGMTPREFDNRLKGYYEAQRLSREEEWERLRVMVSYMISAAGGKGDRVSREFVNPYSKGKKKKTYTKEDLKRISEANSKRFGKKI